MFTYTRTMPPSRARITLEVQEQIVQVLLENSSISCKRLKNPPKNNINNPNYEKKVIYTLNKTKKEIFMEYKKKYEKNCLQIHI